MLERRPQLIPIKEAGNTPPNRVRFNVSLPEWLESERIGIDLRRTQRLMNLGGISHVRVGLLKDPENSVVIPTVVGIAPDGSAYAGKLSAKTKVQYYGCNQSDTRGKPLIQNASWVDLDILVDMEAMKNRIGDREQELRAPESWTPHFDRALKEGIRKTGTKHLLKGHTGLTTLTAIYINLFDGVLSSANANYINPIDGLIRGSYTPYKPTPTTLAAAFSTNFIFYNLVGVAYSNGKVRDGAGYRVSLFPGYEIDRALALQILGRTSTLVKPMDTENS